MDGTLTVAAHDFDAIRRELGLAPGRPILEQLSELPGARARDVRRKLDVIEIDIARRAEVQPGAVMLLDELARRGARLGILTRNSHATALLTLETCGLAAFFDPAFVLGREAVDPKPSPNGVRRLLSLWGARPDDAVMVGDYRFDIEAGRGAGTATVCLDLDGNKEWSALADVAVRSLDELRAIIAREQTGAVDDA